MAVREIKQDEMLESLMEPITPVNSSETPHQTRKYPKFSLPHLNFDDAPNFEIVKYLGIRILVVAFLLWFGLSSTGSINGPAFGRFGGDLALVFYQWQFGNLMAMIGVVVAYDTIKRFI